MKIRWKTFSDEVRRRYLSIFENRKVADIQEDYYSGKWISKGDLQEMYEFEKKEILSAYQEVKQEMNDLKESFNLNAFANYQRLEHKERGQINSNFKPKV
jgi:DNA-binding transcriptional regulator WhiA